MNDRDDAIERLRRGTTPDGSGVAHWEDVDALLSAYDEAVEHEEKLEADLYEQDATAARLVARLAVSREALEVISEDRDEALRLYDALRGPLAIARAALELMRSPDAVRLAPEIAEEALRRMKEVEP